MSAPSGNQIMIVTKDQQAVVVEVGGGLRSYSVGGHKLLDGYDADEMSSSGRGQVLIPWPNRLQDGSYEFNGRRYQLPLNEPEHRNAIHGLVRWSTWTATEREPHRVVMDHILYPQPGYPFLLGISIEYALSDSGLQVRTTATNLGTQSCPYGSGAHPYLTLGTETIDGLILRVPGRTVLRSDERGLPIDVEAVEHTEYNFQMPRRIGSTRFDHAFTDLERDEEGLARVELISSAPYPWTSSRLPAEYERSPPPTSTTTACWSPTAISICSPDGAIIAPFPSGWQREQGSLHGVHQLELILPGPC